MNIKESDGALWCDSMFMGHSSLNVSQLWISDCLVRLITITWHDNHVEITVLYGHKNKWLKLPPFIIHTLCELLLLGDNKRVSMRQRHTHTMQSKKGGLKTNLLTGLCSAHSSSSDLPRRTYTDRCPLQRDAPFVRPAICTWRRLWCCLRAFWVRVGNRAIIGVLVNKCMDDGFDQREVQWIYDLYFDESLVSSTHSSDRFEKNNQCNIHLNGRVNFNVHSFRNVMNTLFKIWLI